MERRSVQQIHRRNKSEKGEDCIMRRRIINNAISVLIALALAVDLSGCAGKSEDTENLTEIVIPESYLQFTGADPEETAESYQEYCTNAEVSGADVVLEVTDKQKDNIMQMNQSFIDKTLEKFKDENTDYSYEMDENYASIVYAYDENIDAYLQAQLLMGVTSIYVLNRMIENTTSEWSVEVTIENCHTGKTVAHGELPEDTLTFGESEWRESYD